MMEKIATADIESNNWIDFLMIGLFDGEHYYVFDSLNDFFKHVLKEKYNGWKIYFHNGGRFDFLFLLSNLKPSWRVTFANSGTGLAGIRISNGRTSISFRDSYKILPASLETLIETFEVSEKKIKVDFTKQHSFDDVRLQKHLENDCISLYKVIQKFSEEFSGNFKDTIASNAFYTYLNDYFKGDIEFINDERDNYIRYNYYTGGRVQVYKGFGKNLYYYDVNSLYPFVMLEPMPQGSYTWTNTFKKRKVGFYEIKLEKSTSLYESNLLYKIGKGNAKGNYWVNGRANETFRVSSRDIDTFEKLGIKFRISQGIYWEHSIPIFNEYVEHYYKMKVNNKGNFKYYLSKLMLNSLYGKFGQRFDFKEIVFDNGKGEIEDARRGLVLINRKSHFKYHAIHIAAWITSLARNYHYNLMLHNGWNNIYYCDTDSFVTSKPMEKKYIGDSLGQLKLEHKVKEGIFLNAKTYALKTTDEMVMKVKGFDSTFSYDDLKGLLLGENKELIQSKERILGFKESVRRKNLIIKDSGKYLKMVRQDKKLVLTDERRRRIEDKRYVFDSLPFHSDEITN